MEDKNTYEDRVQEALHEYAIVQEKLERLVNEFYVNHEEADLFQIIDYIIKKGNPKNKGFLEDFKRKFTAGELELTDINHYNDLYDQHQKLLVEGGRTDV